MTQNSVQKRAIQRMTFKGQSQFDQLKNIGIKNFKGKNDPV
jgi:hypothetical protein